MTDNFANELAKAIGITNKIEYTGSISITQSKPDYNVTFTNGEKTIGRIDMNGDVMTFEGDADESAKKFMDFLAGYFGQRLKEEREKEREANVKLLEDFAKTNMVPAKDTWRMGLIAGANAIRARNKHD